MDLFLEMLRIDSTSSREKALSDFLKVRLPDGRCSVESFDVGDGTENLLENSRAKLQKKGCQMICANSIAQEGAGFGTDTNILTLITPEKTEELPIMTKEQAAGEILTRLMQL